MNGSLKSLDDLTAAGLVADTDHAALAAVAARYAVAITPAMAELIDPQSPCDPIARQFVPTRAELVTTAEERADPIGDDPHSPVEGIVHRYPDRVLLKPVHVCPVYCRFCFRRESVGPQGAATLAPEKLAAALDYIRADARIWEVILTGGDPFVLSPRRVGEITQALAVIPHVRIVRWHTRVPVVDPERITSEFVAALRTEHLATWVALHANHPKELTPAAGAAIARLADAGIALVAQTVLLKGVNDDAGTLEALLRRLVEWRVKPYWLHHGDLAPGTGHFRTTIAEGQALMGDLQRRLSGLARPTYVLDIPGGAGKVPIGPTYLAADGDNWRITDPAGGIHLYPPKEKP